MSSWRLGTRLGVAATVVLALMLVAALVVWTAYGNLAGAERRVTRTLFTAVQRSDNLATAYLNQETGVRGFALTGSTVYLQPYVDGVAQETTANEALDSTLQNEPELRLSLDRLRVAAAAWQLQFAEPAIAQVKARGASSVTAGRLAQGKALFDVVRAREADYNAAIIANRASGIHDLREARTTLLVVFYGGLVALFLALLLLFVALRRWVLRPLAEVGAESLTVASGDIDHAVAVEGPPEFVALASDVELMRRRIRDEYLEAQDARHSLEEQRKILASQTIELQRSNAELEQFAYVASHDLQEPLRKVASFTQLLEQRYGDQLDERAHQYIEFAVDGSKRMQQLVQDLLTFSRVGRGGERFTDVELDHALDVALRSLDHVIVESGAVVTRDPLPVVPGDGGLLAQVFQNLVGNAVKFRRPDEPPRVHVSARETDAVWEISVADHGIGIEPQFAEKVFAIFQRLNRREDYEGTGIGLSLCRKIVEYHGGVIRLEAASSGGAESSGGAATTFTFTLPMLPRPTAVVEGEAS